MSAAHEPAFPRRHTKRRVGALQEDVYYDPGVTTRQYFAGLAMQGLLANPECINLDTVTAARNAVAFADALIRKLEAK